MNGMETYHGHVRTPTDAIILFEACRIGLLPRVQRRLSEKERQSIKSGSVFVWDEREAGMRRWTDGKSWSASRVSGSFLTYREMEGKRGSSGFDKTQQNRDGMQNNEGDEDGGPDGYRYKPDGLMKQSFSITTNGGQHLHLISYFSRSSQAASGLVQPSNDPQLRHIRPEKGMYPESTVHEQSNIPAVTRGPMSSPGYSHAAHQAASYGRPPYGYPPHPGWAPPSPMHTPLPHQGYPPYYHGAPHGAYPGQTPLGVPYPPPGYGHPGMTPYDRPPPMGGTGLPHPGYGAPMPPHGNHYGGYYGHQGGYSGYQPPPLSQPNYPQQPQQSTYGNANQQQQQHQQQQHQQQQHQQQPQQQPQQQATSPQVQDQNNMTKDDRQDSHQTTSSEAHANTAASSDAAAANSTTSADNNNNTTTSPSQAEAGAQQTNGAAQSVPSSGQTIPSISAMLNAGKDGQPPPRNSSRSPSNNGARPLQDIPTHKLGFEVSRDVQALRSLDGYSTLKK